MMPTTAHWVMWRGVVNDAHHCSLGNVERCGWPVMYNCLIVSKQLELRRKDFFVNLEIFEKINCYIFYVTAKAGYIQSHSYAKLRNVIHICSIPSGRPPPANNLEQTLGNLRSLPPASRPWEQQSWAHATTVATI